MPKMRSSISPACWFVNAISATTITPSCRAAHRARATAHVRWYADGILLSNLLGNGAGFTPRWGLVTPEEIERVDVLYGPFSAAFPGNSAGAVVDYITRMPESFEAHAKVAAFSQHFSLYRTEGNYRGNQVSASLGNRAGNFAWWLNVNRLDNDGQPLTFATKVVSVTVLIFFGLIGFVFWLSSLHDQKDWADKQKEKGA